MDIARALINGLTDDLIKFPAVFPASRLKEDIVRLLDILKRDTLYHPDGTVVAGAFRFD